MDDSWSPDNRMVAVLTAGALLSEMQSIVNAEHLREIYPDLLKRLDDSNDQIRVVVCKALVTFFQCLPPKWSNSLYEYILKTLFIHLDDPAPSIQDAVYEVLQAAVHQDYDIFIKEAKAAGAKSTNQEKVQELLRNAENLQKVSDVSVEA